MGNPKIRKETAYRNDFTIRSAIDEEVDIVRYLYLEKEYDDRGNPVVEKTYDENGDIQEYLTYRYDDLNRKTEVQNYYDEEEIIETTHFEFKEGTEPVSARRVYADGSEDTIIFTYDGDGKLIERKSINDEGEEEERIVKQYNEKGQEVFYERIEQGEPVFRETQEYDAEGRLTKVILWEGDMDKTTDHRLYYDEEGNQYRIEKYNHQGNLFSVIEIPEYEQGRPMAIEETGSAGFTRTVFSYDSEGRAVIQQEFNQEGVIVNEIIRTYDSQGNLTSTEVTSDRLGAGMNLHYRIEYFYEFF